MSVQSEARRFAALLREAERRGIKQGFGWVDAGGGRRCAFGAVGEVLGVGTDRDKIADAFPVMTHLDAGMPWPYSAVFHMNDTLRLTFSEIADFLDATPAWAWRAATQATRTAEPEEGA